MTIGSAAHRLRATTLRRLSALQHTALGAALACVIAAGSPTSVAAQVESDIRDCLRFVQSYERSLKIPAGLLLAVAFVESGREVGGERIPWPWTMNAGGDGAYFDRKADAIAAVRKRLDDGERSIDVGCMQVNLRYHPNAFRDLETAFDPAANVAYAAQYLRSLYRLQGSWAKAVERYHSSDDGRREEYREKVLAFWNGDARRMILSVVAAEEVDTPYHRAVRDFAAGRFADALDKYQGLVDRDPRDRLALLGVAMSYDALGRADEARQAYAKTLQAEPENEAALARYLALTTRLDAALARADLAGLVKSGVGRPEVLAALSDAARADGDEAAAFTHISDAIARAPGVAAYHLNAAILADRLRRPGSAIVHYDEFLRIYAENPTLIDASIDGVRERVRFLKVNS
ncbi:MAG: transglycosylase SLT domain-containing protein [Rhodospirillaceae bacterium]|nr:transglycosylase SLT domain-containing protein [Rhodospirillaceae bacterium]